MHIISSWDFGMLFNTSLKNGKTIAAAPAWQAYNGETIKLNSGDTLKINALRIGYRNATFDYVER
jgi:hypothetical protein